MWWILSGLLVLIVWALPRLARRFGVQPATALWLGALNPLLIFHFVAGAHNDALAIGLMLAGLEVGIRKLPIRVKGDGSPSSVIGRTAISAPSLPSRPLPCASDPTVTTLMAPPGSNRRLPTSVK